MLRSVKQLQGTALRAQDGEIGKVHEFLFDDKEWTIRYVVVNTGSWLTGRLVLISPLAFGPPDWEARTIPVALTREQIANAPDIETDAPVSRQHEVELSAYYGWPAYWPAVPILPGGMPTAGPAVPLVPAPGGDNGGEGNGGGPQHEADPHLRGTREVIGYHIQARDGKIGQVDDLLFDDEPWMVRYLVVDTGSWLAGRKVLVSPSWVRLVDWADALVHVDLARDTIEASPEFDAEMIDREYEAELREHYEGSARQP